MMGEGTGGGSSSSSPTRASAGRRYQEARVALPIGHYHHDDAHQESSNERIAAPRRSALAGALAALAVVAASALLLLAAGGGRTRFWSSSTATTTASDLAVVGTVGGADFPLGPSRLPSPARDELARLDRAMEGRVWFLGDGPGFDDAARVWRRDVGPPAAVVEALCEGDVRLAVPVLGRLSKEHGVPFRIRSGGHNKAGFSTVPGGIVLSLRHMRSLSLHANSSAYRGAAGSGGDTVVASIQPGARVEDVLDELLAKEGYAGALGQCGRVAEGGFVLGGGVGFASRLLGLGADSVREFRVVLADGSVRACSQGRNPDLFWALRGAGSGNFGVVTSIEYELRQMPETQLFKPVQFRLGDLAEFLFKLGEAGASREFMMVVGGRVDLDALAYMSWFSSDADVVQQGNARFEQEIAPLLKSSADPGPYQEVNWATTTHQISDMGYGAEVWAAQAWQGFLFAENNTQAVWNDVMAIMEAGMKAAPDLEPHIELWGGAIADVPPSATAFPYREAIYNVGVLLVIQDFEADSANRFQEQVASVNAWWPSMAKYLTGAYLNYPMNSLSRTEYPRVYWGEHLERLVEIKQRYDPGDVFSYEQSIPLALQ